MLKSILLEFEKEAFSTNYAEYFAVKRNNFFTNIQRFSDLWQCFMALDDIWMQEFEAFKQLPDPNAGLPVSLFIHAHALFRQALEAGFTGSLAECYNLFRMAIESAYHAHLVLEQPALATTWKNPDAKNEFKRAFNQNKKIGFERLGLAELHKWWLRYSEWGHIGEAGLSGGRLKTIVSGKVIQFEVRNFETDEKVLLLALMDMLHASQVLEEAFFERFQTRFCLDPRFSSAREAFLQRSEVVRRAVKLDDEAMLDNAALKDLLGKNG